MSQMSHTLLTEQAKPLLHQRSLVNVPVPLVNRQTLPTSFVHPGLGGLPPPVGVVVLGLLAQGPAQASELGSQKYAHSLGSLYIVQPHGKLSGVVLALGNEGEKTYNAHGWGNRLVI